MSRIGFVLLTHSKPHQIQRLVTRLNTMFDAPPIVIHHDFGKCPLTDDLLPANVSFVRPHFDTGWAAFTVVQGTIQAIKQLFGQPDAPDWCVVLSGSCYPTKPAAQILENLTAGGFDAHIDVQEIGVQFQQTEWHRKYYRRHCVKYFHIPSVDKRQRPRTRRIELPPALGQYFLPFGKSLRSFGGSQWFSLNRRAAAYLVDFQATPAAAALAKHYQDRSFSEEVYFQTVLSSAPDLKLDPDNWVYLDWSLQQYHPKQLTLEDLDALEASPTHFARKIDIDTDSDLLDALDRLVDAKADAPEKVSA